MMFFSHPNKPYINHITNMIDEGDTKLEIDVKKFHDIAKLKQNFQIYIQDNTKNKDKNHSFLSAFIFLLNSNYSELDTIFGFLSILSHHENVKNLFDLLDNELGISISQRSEIRFFDEVVKSAKTLEIYQNLNENLDELEQKTKSLSKFLLKYNFKPFSYNDFIDFKLIYSNLIYSDKFEAIFNQKKENLNKIDIKILENYIQNLPYNQKRVDFRNFVLENFNPSHKLFTLTAPTGYGKTLTALNFALKFCKQRIIFTLPFTAIIDQTFDNICEIFNNENIQISKIHHKAKIDENVPEDRYSQVKFLLQSFSNEINITTLYQIIFTIFGNKNKDNVKFNQLKNSVIIIDEAQAIPYKIRKDFIKICEIISEKLDCVFIFMSATMPLVSQNFIEISNLEYFKNQNRYTLKFLDANEEELKEKIKFEAKTKHTLVVVNEIKKAQELYQYFQNDYECYCLNGYMCDDDKQKVIEILKNKLQDLPKILLISTQSIEAGIDLSFEVGFREISPISSIIQTAGRINRHFGENQGTLYVFDKISKHTDLIYGDLQLISKSIIEILKQKDIQECEILEFSQIYFQKIHNQLETNFLKTDMEKLNFRDIFEKIDKIMSDNYKEFLLIEPEIGFIETFENELQELLKMDKDKFLIKDLRQNIVKKLIRFGVNISKNDKDKIGTNLKQVRFLKNMDYLPCGNTEYDKNFGFMKFQSECFT